MRCPPSHPPSLNVEHNRHDCDVWNQDDTFAVKANDENTENVLIENVRASGVGLTIGSIGGCKLISGPSNRPVMRRFVRNE